MMTRQQSNRMQKLHSKILNVIKDEDREVVANALSMAFLFEFKEHSKKEENVECFTNTVKSVARSFVF